MGQLEPGSRLVTRSEHVAICGRCESTTKVIAPEDRFRLVEGHEREPNRLAEVRVENAQCDLPRCHKGYHLLVDHLIERHYDGSDIRGPYYFPLGDSRWIRVECGITFTVERNRAEPPSSE